jgi:hypothetical protein
LGVAVGFDDEVNVGTLDRPVDDAKPVALAGGYERGADDLSALLGPKAVELCTDLEGDVNGVSGGHVWAPAMEHDLSTSGRARPPSAGSPPAPPEGDDVLLGPPHKDDRFI